MPTALQLERSIQLIEVELRSRQLSAYRNRLDVLRADPNQLEPEDLDALTDMPARMRDAWLKHNPEIRERYNDAQRDPEQIASSFLSFLRLAWPHAGIDKPFVCNWHHELLCSEYESLAAGDFLRMLVNQPPGTTKSLIAGVFFMAWRWTINPRESCFYGSYSDEIPKTTNRHLKTLLTSKWYRRRWGKKFTITKCTEKDIVNSAGGWRIGRGVGGGGTGQHPDYVFVDDPQKGIATSSANEMRKAALWYANTLATRGIMKNARHAIIQQRLATNDLSGVVLGEVDAQDNDNTDDGNALAELSAKYIWHHVCLPMRFKPESEYRHPKDPRTAPGELLWPDVMNQEHVAATINGMRLAGEPNPEAQLDQHPRQSQSNMFPDIGECRIAFANLPRLIQQGRAIRSWDRAGTEGDGDYSVGVLIVKLEGRYYILDVVRKQLHFTQRDELICRTAQHDARMFPTYRVVNEIMPGPDGKQVHSELARKLAAIGVHLSGQPATKSKPVRAAPFSGAVANSLVFVLDGKPWTDRFIDEYSRFPNGSYDDQVDAGAHGYNAHRDWDAGKLL